VINNGVKLKTKSVFSEFCGPFCARTDFKKSDILREFNNSLQIPAIKLEDSLERVIADIKVTNPVSCGVSGSGSSCFGFYTNCEAASFAKRSLSARHKFVRISRL
jgi:4-diphosphocytidyl-2C-methyl-D-erythritol kinase